MASNHSHRVELQQQFVLLADLEDDRQLRLAIGHAAELDSIETIRASLGVPR